MALSYNSQQSPIMFTQPQSFGAKLSPLSSNIPLSNQGNSGYSSGLSNQSPGNIFTNAQQQQQSAGNFSFGNIPPMQGQGQSIGGGQPMTFGTNNNNNNNFMNFGNSGNSFGGGGNTNAISFSTPGNPLGQQNPYPQQFPTPSSPYKSNSPFPQGNPMATTQTTTVSFIKGQGNRIKKFEPLRSKNNKIDNKHLIKCIALLPENANHCKKQIRINYIMQTSIGNSLGGAIGFGMPTTSSFGFGVGGGTNGASNLGPNAGPNVGPGNPNIFGSNANNNSFLGGFNTGNNSNNINMLNNNSFNTGTFNNNQQQQQQFSFNNFGQQKQNPFGQAQSFSSIAGQPPQQNNQYSFLGKPQTPSPFPQQSGVSVFPTLLANPQRTPQINNAAISLANNILGPPQPQPQFLPQIPAQPQNNTLFNSQPNTGNQNMGNNGSYENMVLSAFINSEIFRNILNSKKQPFDKVQESAKNLKTPSQRLLSFGEDQFQKEERQLNSSSYKNNKKLVNLQISSKPYIFSQIKTESRYLQNWAKKEKEIKLSRVSVRSSNILNSQIFKKTKFDEFQENYEKFNKMVLKEITAKHDDLPVNDIGYLISPNIGRLSQFTVEQLQKVKNFTIENKYGKVKFLSPVNLLKKRFSQCIEISQDSIQIKDSQWQQKNCEMHYKNFAGYKSASESQKRRIERKMKIWANRNNMDIVSFDETTGDVIVEMIIL